MGDRRGDKCEEGLQLRLLEFVEDQRYWYGERSNIRGKGLTSVMDDADENGKAAGCPANLLH